MPDPTGSPTQPRDLGPKPAARPGRPWNVFALLAALFFFLLVSVHWIRGTSLTYENDQLKGGDLTQHYVAGLLWKEGRSADLYRDFRFSNRFIEWIASLPVKVAMDIRPDSFNYVYPPLVARIASFFTRWSFSAWLWISLAFMACSSILAWCLLGRLETGLNPRRYEDWGLLLSYPCLWLTLIPHQNATLTLFLASLGAFLSARGFPFSAGAVLACAFYKPHFVLALGLIVLAAGRIRLFLGMASGTALILGAQLYLFGWDLNRGWVASMNTSLGGGQFQWAGLNQTWRGWALSLPGLTGPAGAWSTLALSIALCILAGWWLRKLERSGALRPGHLLILAVALWTVVSPYAAYYDFLLLVGLWAATCRVLPDSPRNLLLCFLGWVVALGCVSGEMDVAWLTAPLVTLWLVLAIRSMASANSPVFNRT